MEPFITFSGGTAVGASGYHYLIWTGAFSDDFADYRNWAPCDASGGFLDVYGNPDSFPSALPSFPLRPNSSDSLLIWGATTNPVNVNTSRVVHARELFLNSGSLLTLSPDTMITIHDKIQIDGGQFVVPAPSAGQNAGSLVQLNQTSANAVSSGYYEYQHVQSVKTQDAIVLACPVTNSQTINDAEVAPNGDVFYEKFYGAPASGIYPKNTSWQNFDGSDQFATGVPMVGYANFDAFSLTGDPNTEVDQTISFKGVPNDGTINVDMKAKVKNFSAAWLSNPYSCALNIRSFLWYNLNNFPCTLDGQFFGLEEVAIWTHKYPHKGGTHYPLENFTNMNLFGSVNHKAKEEHREEWIEAGESFCVPILQDVSSPVDASFQFIPGNEMTVHRGQFSATKRHRMWINLDQVNYNSSTGQYDPAGPFSQGLFGYVEDGVQFGYNSRIWDYERQKFPTVPTGHSIYAMGTDPNGTQSCYWSKALSLTDNGYNPSTDEIPLGVTIVPYTNAGVNYSISLDAADGMFATDGTGTENIWLYDYGPDGYDETTGAGTLFSNPVSSNPCNLSAVVDYDALGNPITDKYIFESEVDVIANGTQIFTNRFKIKFTN